MNLIRPEKSSASYSVARDYADPVNSILDAIEAALEDLLAVHDDVEGTFFTIRFDVAPEEPSEPGVDRLSATVTAQPRKAGVNKRRG